MPAPDRITFTRATPAEVAARMAEFDPNERLEMVTIRRARSREEALRDFDESCRKFSEQAQERGLTMDEFCDIMEIDEEMRRNLFGE